MIRAPMKAWRITVLSGIAVGLFAAALAAIPAVHRLEQRVGLQWLFDLRGPVEPPDYAILVLMNERAASEISLPREPERFHRCEDLRVGAVPSTHVKLPELPSRWPRCVHARLLDRLSEAAAKLVVFDVVFRERPPLPASSGDLHAWQDQIFAKAAAANRVLIAQKVEESDGIEHLANLSPAIADSVLGAAPFPLVAEPNRRFDRFMAFKEEGLVTATLPALAVHAQSAGEYAALRTYLVQRAGENATLLAESAADVEAQGQLQATALLVRTLARGADSGEIDQQSARATGALGAMYLGEGIRFLNIYGPAGTLSAVGFDEALGGTAAENRVRFGGKVVFVGYGETLRTEQVEHFATVYSGKGSDLSGVEIVATAFSNLLDDKTLRPFPMLGRLALTFLAGFLSFVICQALGNRAAIATVAVLVGVYVAIASMLFNHSSVWIPVVIPLAVSVPLGALPAFGWKFWTAHRQRARLRDAFSHFVPKEVVAKLERNVGALHDNQESIECACVATDAANFTPLAEAMPPEELAEFLNRYYESLFGRVAERGGFVSDVVGDAMLAIWPDRTADTRSRVLHALLEMLDAVSEFNAKMAGDRLNTRFGVDWGRVALTTVGSDIHYEYRAVGDAVNTAQRIQELNKRLKTRILVSGPLMLRADGEFLSRNLGSFLLRGKSHPVEIHELMGLKAAATPAEKELCARSSEAVRRIEQGDLDGARTSLAQSRLDWPGDGPLEFLAMALEGGIARANRAWVVN